MLKVRKPVSSYKRRNKNSKIRFSSRGKKKKHNFQNSHNTVT